MLKLHARPNVDSYTESIQFSTNFFVSINGFRESKDTLVNYKYIVKYTSFIFYASKHRAFINLFRGGLTTTVVQPLWGQAAKITSSGEGVTVIPCEHQGSNFEVGMDVFVTAGNDRFNVVELLDIGVNSLTVATPVDIIQNTVILPSFVGIVTGEVNSTYSGENYAACEIRVEELR